MRVKKIDFLILKELISDSRKTSKEIAQATGATDKTVRNRITQMRENGIFTPTIIIDHKKFGYGIKMDMFIKSDREHVEKIFELLEKKYFFNVTYMGMHWGEDDISIQTIFKDTKEVFVFRQQIKQIETAEIVSMKMVPYVFKDTNDWLPSPEDFKMNIHDVDEELKKLEPITIDYQEMIKSLQR